MSRFSGPTARMNSHLLAGGDVVTWTRTAGSPVSVTVLRSDPTALAAAGVMMTLFGTMADSGFTQMPAKNDAFTVAAVAYRVFDVQGPDESGGIYLHLTK